MTLSERIEFITGNIAGIEADVIVNAANSRLAGGGGVDGAIHRAAGPGLLRECLTLGGCPAGEAKITAGYNLTARFIIHTVGPIWSGGYKDEPQILASCYRHSLAIAADKRLITIAFPAISTGAYGFPSVLAAHIALKEVIRFLGTNSYPEKVIFVLWSQEDLETYLKAYSDETSSKENR